MHDRGAAAQSHFIERISFSFIVKTIAQDTRDKYITVIEIYRARNNLCHLGRGS